MTIFDSRRIVCGQKKRKAKRANGSETTTAVLGAKSEVTLSVSLPFLCTPIEDLRALVQSPRGAILRIYQYPSRGKRKNTLSLFGHERVASHPRTAYAPAADD